MKPHEPREQLQAGIEVLNPFLNHVGYQFQFEQDGTGSGGHYAYGRFINGDRSIELHQRWGLGIVNYQIGDLAIDHSSYLAGLGVDRDSHYLWLRLELGIERYNGLLQDLQEFCDDFLTGDADQWRKIAMAHAEAEKADQFHRELGCVGDERKIQQAREAFRIKEYARVVKLLESVESPDALSEPQQNMLELSRNRRFG
jgi:hypothetical protein